MAAAEEEKFLTAAGYSNDISRSWDPPQSNQSDERDSEQRSMLPAVTRSPEPERGAGLLPDGAEGVTEDGVKSNDVILAELERQEPRDRFNLVYIIMVIHGVGLLMPWNMFITAKSYFEDHKLQPAVNQTSSAELDDYRTNFMSYIGMASQFPCTIMNLVNLFLQCGGKPGVRIVGSIIVCITVFILTLVLAMVDSSEWPEAFFWITLFSAVMINSATGVYQNSLMGAVANLPMKYTNAVIFGTNFSGTFVSVLNILMIAMAPDTRSSAMYYFLSAVLILLIAMDFYFVLPHTKFYRHYQRVMKLKQEQRQRSRPQQETCCERLQTYWKVFKEIWVLAVSVWFVFFVSLALFPQVQSDIKRQSFPIPDAYWTPVFCYLSFNVFAMLGNLLTEFVRIVSPSMIFVCLVSAPCLSVCVVSLLSPYFNAYALSVCPLSLSLPVWLSVYMCLSLRSLYLFLSYYNNHDNDDNGDEHQQQQQQQYH